MSIELQKLFVISKCKVQTLSAMASPTKSKKLETIISLAPNLSLQTTKNLNWS
jgi:hypothetical protein